MGEFRAVFREQAPMNASFGEVMKVSTSDYEELYNKPSIEGRTLLGDQTMRQLGVDTLSVQEIEKLLYLG